MAFQINMTKKEIGKYLKSVAAQWRNSIFDTTIERTLKRLTTSERCTAPNFRFALGRMLCSDYLWR